MFLHAFLNVLFNVTLPIFILIGIGFVMDKAFRLDLRTLSKLNFYIFCPALVFIKLLDAKLTGGDMTKIALFTIVHLIVLYAFAHVIFSRKRFRSDRTILSLGSALFNAGNYGIPLVILAFGDRYVGVCAVIIMVQNLVVFTYGVYMMEKEGTNAGRALARLLKVPIIYAVGAALLCRAFGREPIAQIKEPLNYLANGLIPVALITLGAQLSRVRLGQNVLPVAGVTVMRLFVSPIAALFLGLAFGFEPAVLSVLIVVAGLPVAVNVFILSSEYRRGEEIASQIIFWTTLLSALTIALLITIVTRMHGAF